MPKPTETRKPLTLTPCGQVILLSKTFGRYATGLSLAVPADQSIGLSGRVALAYDVPLTMRACNRDGLVEVLILDEQPTAVAFEVRGFVRGLLS